MADYQTIETGSTLPRGFKVVRRADGAPVTAGTVNYYLTAVTGANAGKWWRDSDQTWQATEQANAMTHVADGSWKRALAASPWTDGAAFVEYAKESGDLHVPVDRWLKAAYTPSADADRRVDLGAVNGNATAAADLETMLGDYSGGAFTASVASVAGNVGAVLGDVSGNVVGRVLGDNATDFVGLGVRADVTAWAGSAVVLASGSGLTPRPAVNAYLAGIWGNNLAAPAAGGNWATAFKDVFGQSSTAARDLVAAALLDLADGVESGRTVRNALRGIAAVLLGKASGLGTTSQAFRDTNDTKTRVAAALDGSGGRTNTLDLD